VFSMSLPPHSALSPRANPEIPVILRKRIESEKVPNYSYPKYIVPL
jgi:hypothetical protein